ncbi:unnamed protein product [Choristocarpus tenellus]
MLSVFLNRDSVSLFDTNTWEALLEFAVDTLDLASLQFSPDGYTLCLQDTSLE